MERLMVNPVEVKAKTNLKEVIAYLKLNINMCT